MQYEFVRGPYMLLETAAMVSNYLNECSFSSVLYKLRLRSEGNVSEKRVRVLRRLQEITETLCSGLDKSDPVLQRYFTLLHNNGQELSVAFAMIVSFWDLDHPELRENAEAICRRWKELLRKGCCIAPESYTYLSFHKPAVQSDLFDQICAMEVPTDFQLRLYGALRQFERSMEQIVQLLEPLSRRLEEIYREESWLFESVEEEWQEAFIKQPPEEFLQTFMGDMPWNTEKPLRIAVSLMYCNRLLLTDEREIAFGLDYEFLYIGSGLPTDRLTRQRTPDLDSIASTLRFLGDRKRLEILQRLDRQPSYGVELADSLGMDYGNMSRTLQQLYSRGFLKQEREDTRRYYQTDRESLASFLEMVEKILLPKHD